MKKQLIIGLWVSLLTSAVTAQTFPVNNLQINGVVSGNVTGNGNVVLQNGSAANLSNATGLPISTGVSGLGTGVAAGLANASTGSAGPVLATAPTISQLSATSQNIAYTNTYAPGVRAPLFIWQNPNGSLPAGTNAGQQIWIGNNPTATPAAGDVVASTMAVTNGNNRSLLYGQNLLVGICGTPEGCTTTDYINGPVTGQEIDVYGSAAFTPLNRAFNASAGTYVINGQEVYCQGPQYCTSAYSAWSTSTNGSNWFKEGSVYNRIADIGVHFVITPGDSGPSFTAGAIVDDSNSTNVINIGAGAHTFYILAPNFKVVSNGLVIPGSYNVSSLPTCGAGTQGAIAYVHDAAAPTYNGALSGGGGVAVLAFCNGSAWTSH